MIADSDELRDVAALAVHQLEGWAIWRSPAVAPLPKCDDHWPEVAALFGQDIVEARGTLVVGNPLEHAFVDEMGEPSVEHVAGDAEAFLEFVETCDAQEGVADDQEAPPLTNDLQALADGAVHLPETRSLHDCESTQLREETHLGSVSCLKQLTLLDRVYPVLASTTS